MHGLIECGYHWQQNVIFSILNKLLKHFWLIFQFEHFISSFKMFYVGPK